MPDLPVEIVSPRGIGGVKVKTKVAKIESKLPQALLYRFGIRSTSQTTVNFQSVIKVIFLNLQKFNRRGVNVSRDLRNKSRRIERPKKHLEKVLQAQLKLTLPISTVPMYFSRCVLDTHG